MCKEKYIWSEHIKRKEKNVMSNCVTTPSTPHCYKQLEIVVKK